MKVVCLPEGEDPLEPRGESLATVLAYHERTKHHRHRLARSLGFLDWETQPDPFRRYAGAEVVGLDLMEPGPDPSYAAMYRPGRLEAAPVDRSSVSRLFHDALALSAWKEMGPARWSLRVNPSSGNLHPTEGYLLAGPVPGLLEAPALCHYAPRLHALEVRARLEESHWAELRQGLPEGALLVGLTSIHWRESWKYGERAFRYCHHDAGHAIAAVSLAAACLGWETRLLDGWSDADLGLLLGVASQEGPEAEHPDGLLAVFPAGSPWPSPEGSGAGPAEDPRDRLRSLALSGEPNRLSAAHQPWPVIDAVAEATVRPAPAGRRQHGESRGSGEQGRRMESPGQPGGQDESPRREEPGATRRDGGRPGDGDASGPGGARKAAAPAAGAGAAGAEPGTRGARAIPARRIIHQRRSAVAMDGRTSIKREAFLGMMERTLPLQGRPPFAALAWRPAIHLLLFAHRVEGLEPGLYALVREAGALGSIREAMRPEFHWSPPEGCPEDLPLHLLARGDCRDVARASSCGQEIASDGAFAAAMIGELEPRLRQEGPWFYKRLHWEAGCVGQVLYLEAEAAGVRSTGIGCFFDDDLHRAAGLEGTRFQDIYHFTVGGAVEDTRLRTAPPYAHLER